ncbi:Nucleoside-diphosphate-sugar epimerase [Flexibacter flexilis DSM 6793]|uniref:Nucleoside-diphosphate-sugar epimerase n=1 Tax=Flexibacter flexilis DSM 6793 TaxID=927664 RepID=A0A1I1MV74_9BACT|nr:NAD(P)H-binding protein [Flexibacter flexilis]SFC89347.1 Nucleoside-diphosphate-sugar epimerase [Flexibacter flexilis DSM 6793]
MKKITVVGCGWLGWPLAQTLQQKGYSVSGTVRTPDKCAALQAANPQITMWVWDTNDFTQQINSSLLAQTQTLIICYPPTRGAAPTQYAQNLERVLQCAMENGVQEVIFTSSTSVYPDLPQIFTETSDTNGGSAAILEAEKICQLYSKFLKINILRLGGLLAADRNPARYLNPDRMPNGNASVNFVHRQDVIGVILALLEKNIAGQILNVVADLHPLRRDFYAYACPKIGRVCPPFPSDQNLFNRLIVNDLLKEKLAYQFLFPNPLQMLEQ